MFRTRIFSLVPAIGLAGAVALTLAFAMQIAPAGAQETDEGSRHLPPGDVNGDRQVNIGDPIFLLSFLFSGGPEPVDDSPRPLTPEMIELVQTSSQRILEDLPGDDVLHELPRRIARAYLAVREVYENAFMEAPAWTTEDLARHRSMVKNSVSLTALLTWTVCQFIPSLCVDPDCIDRCEAEYNACLDDCPPVTDPGYFQCSLACTEAFFDCTQGCTDWSALFRR